MRVRIRKSAQRGKSCFSGELLLNCVGSKDRSRFILSMNKRCVAVSVIRKLMFLPPIVAGVALVAYAMSSKEPPATIALQEKRTPVRVLVAAPQSFIPRVSGFGAVEPARTWNAVAQVAGRVIEVNPAFVHGGTVRAGDLLVRIAPDDYELAIAQAQAQIESAAAELEEMRLSERTLRSSLDIEKAALAIAAREVERQRDLASRNTVAAATVETKESAMLAQRAKVQDLENQLAVLPSRLKALEQSKAVTEATLDIAELNLERTVVTAPFEARVAEADVEVSQYVGVGTKMGSLDGIAAAEIDVQISPRQMGDFVRLAFGESERLAGSMPGQVPPGSGFGALVRIGAPGVWEGWEAEVKRISDTVDPKTRSIGVIVSVPEPYGQAEPGKRPPLIKGMFADVELYADAVNDVILLPRHAARNGKIMLVDDESRLAMADVDITYTYQDVVVLKGGIQAGAKVIIGDLSPAIEGMLLEPIVDEATAERLAAAAARQVLGE